MEVAWQCVMIQGRYRVDLGYRVKGKARACFFHVARAYVFTHGSLFIMPFMPPTPHLSRTPHSTPTHLRGSAFKGVSSMASQARSDTVVAAIGSHAPISGRLPAWARAPVSWRLLAWGWRVGGLGSPMRCIKVSKNPCAACLAAATEADGAMEAAHWETAVETGGKKRAEAANQPKTGASCHIFIWDPIRMAMAAPVAA